MYAHCIYCSASLGTNELIEAQPIGRKIAYDPERGRLWVVCGACARWNLSPFESRWEAIEACERVFPTAEKRATTPNVTLARHRAGIALVRVGPARTPEYAAWRYATQLLRRRWKWYAALAGGMVVTVGLNRIAIAAGMPVAAHLGWSVSQLLQRRRLLVRLPGPSGRPIDVRHENLSGLEWVPPSGESDWRLRLTSIPSSYQSVQSLEARRRLRERGTLAEVAGDEAWRVVRPIMAAMNSQGATRKEVQAALAWMERADPFRAPPDPDTLTWVIPRAWNEWGPRGELKVDRLDSLPLSLLPIVQRHAMEIAADAEVEQQAMDGEVRLLESAWRDAEELAMLADSLVPAWLSERVTRLRRDQPGPGKA